MASYGVLNPHALSSQSGSPALPGLLARDQRVVPAASREAALLTSLRELVCYFGELPFARQERHMKAIRFREFGGTEPQLRGTQHREPAGEILSERTGASRSI